MTKISIQGSGGGAPLPDGNLQIKDGLPIDATLQTVSDQAGNDSILNISTESVGIGTTTATGLLNLFKPSAAVRLMINGDTAQNKLISFRTGGLQRFGVYVNNTAETGSNVGSDFAIRRYTDAGTLGGTPLFVKRSTGNVGINTLTPAATLDVNGTANIAERLTIEADSTATTQSTAVIQNTTLNSGIALVPNGTGAITADIPDGTITGGNARGNNAVDLQTERGNADQVASARSSVIVAGTQNRITSVADYSGILGGNGNVITGQNAVIPGGSQNAVGSNFSTVSGGQSNTASTSTHATVVGGQSNVSSGEHSVSGGQSNTASGSRSIVFGSSNISNAADQVVLGQNNTANSRFSYIQGAFNVSNLGGGGFFSAIVGFNNTISAGANNYILGESNTINSSGIRNVAIGNFSTISGTASNAMAINGGRAIANDSLGKGVYGNAYLFNSESRGYAGDFGGNIRLGQETTMVAGRIGILSSATTFILSLDGSGVSNLIIPLDENRMWNVKVSTIATVSLISGTATGVSVGDSFMENESILFKRVSGTSSIVGLSTDVNISDTSMTTASMAYTAGASQELSLAFTAPTFAGGGNLTLRVISKVELVEVKF